MSVSCPGLPLIDRSAGRHERRRTLVGIGVCNVHNYALEVFGTECGRILWRGRNGCGKTTLLESTVPFLLILDERALHVGKNRSTTLAGLMEEGARGSKRAGYLWLTAALPHSPGTTGDSMSFGVRLDYSKGAQKPVTLTAFRLPGPVLDLIELQGAFGEALSGEDFEQRVRDADGAVFEDAAAYRQSLAAELLGTDQARLVEVCRSIRRIRDPHSLHKLQPREAEELLRSALPKVNYVVLSSTSDAMAAAAATRDHLVNVTGIADLTSRLALAWAGHVAQRAADAAAVLTRRTEAVAARHVEHDQAQEQVAQADQATGEAEERLARAEATCVRLQANVEVLEADEALDGTQITQAQDRRDRAQEGVDRAEAALRSALAADGVLRRARAEAAQHLADDFDSRLAGLDPADQLALNGIARPVTVGRRPREALRASTIVFPRSEHLAVEARRDRADALVAAVAERRTEAVARANLARAAIDAHQPCQDAEQAAEQARRIADAARAAADTDRRQAKEAAAHALVQAAAFLEAADAWVAEHHGALCAALGRRQRDLAAQWAVKCRAAEPGAVLTTHRQWLTGFKDTAARLASRAVERSAAHHHIALTGEAAAERARSRAALWSGGHLDPLPGPGWLASLPGHAGNAGAVLFGEVLEWGERAPQPGPQRDLLEAVIGATGLLAATLTADGAADRAGAWSVRAVGQPQPDSLADVLSTVPGHPLSDAAAQVLARTALCPSAESHDSGGDGAALVVGRDGSYRAGPFTGRLPACAVGPARHIGIEARRAHAQAAADAARTEADRLHGTAIRHRRAQSRLVSFQARLGLAVNALPDTESLRDAEAGRARAAPAPRPEPPTAPRPPGTPTTRPPTPSAPTTLPSRAGAPRPSARDFPPLSLSSTALSPMPAGAPTALRPPYGRCALWPRA
ncbi:hypothetical protein ACWGKU_18245 [Kitasatospora sp. NPDC054768]